MSASAISVAAFGMELKSRNTDIPHIPFSLSMDFDRGDMAPSGFILELVASSLNPLHSAEPPG
jgi:hypothetical protein